MKVLTFDIEEWFHILDNNETKSISEWNKFDSRIQFGMDIIYEIFSFPKLDNACFPLVWPFFA